MRKRMRPPLVATYGIDLNLGMASPVFGVTGVLVGHGGSMTLMTSLRGVLMDLVSKIWKISEKMSEISANAHKVSIARQIATLISNTSARATQAIAAVSSYSWHPICVAHVWYKQSRLECSNGLADVVQQVTFKLQDRFKVVLIILIRNIIILGRHILDQCFETSLASKDRAFLFEVQAQLPSRLALLFFMGICLDI